MSSQPDLKIPQEERNSAEDPLSGTKCLRPVSSQPDDGQTVIAEFDPLSLFPAECETPAEESSEKASIPSEEHATQRTAAAGRDGFASTFENERTALEDLRAQLRETKAAIQQSLSEAGDLKTDLDEARALAAQLTRDYGTIKESSREAREDSRSAIAALKDIEQRFGGMVALRELGTQTDERLAALDALAEDVTHKTRALEDQRSMIERTLIEASRLNETVRARDSQTAKLNGVSQQQVARTEEMLRRIDKLAAQTTAQLEHVTKVKDKLGREITRFEREAQTITGSIGNHVKQLIVKKKEFELFDRHLRAVGTAFAERATAVESRDRPIEPALGTRDAGVNTTADGREANWVLHRRRMGKAQTILFIQISSWAVRHAARALRGLGALALLSFIIMRSVGDADRIRMNEMVSQAQPSLDPSPYWTPGIVRSSAATRTQIALPTPEPPSVGEGGEKVPVRAREYVGTLGVQSEPAGAAAFINRRPVGTTPLRRSLEQLSVGGAVGKIPVRAREYIGALAVESDPAGAAVFLNRRPVGTTPLRLQRLSAGSHTLWLEREGYQRWTAAVLVPADRLTRVDVRLRRDGPLGR